MKDYNKHTLTEYIEALSSRNPVPGGGSVSSLNGALGAALIEMVANYSVGKTGSAVGERKIQSILKTAGELRVRFLELVDEDARAYLAFSRIPKTDRKAKARADRTAKNIQREVCRLSKRALDLTPFLVSHGNPFLITDVEIAVEQLWSAYRAAAILIRPEQHS
jgi:methenyltetrahydrofolate cyclohydrolase